MGELVYAAWETIISWLQIKRDGIGLDTEHRARDAVVERRAIVVNVEGRAASLEYEDGAAQTVDVPERIGVRAGMPVVDHADGRLAYLWDAPKP